MHRRGVGAGAIAKKKLAEAKYKERGTVLAEDQLAQMSKQLDMFKTNLEEFASKHKQEIRKNPEFRVQFQDMCATIGVDPLASGKGFWSEMLGVGDFYYELGVQIIEVCLALKHRNGGLITLEELHQQVLKGRGKFAQEVSQDDLLRAIKKLKVLGSGFGIIPVGGTLAEGRNGLAGYTGSRRTSVLAACSLYRVVLSGNHSRGSQGGNTLTAKCSVPVSKSSWEGTCISPETQGQ
uniref:Vacuolar-sorting protein SNF8 n=1 Tax=Gallus gallus TaxID=9031 RepID=A0A8V1AAX2_CHICK